MARPKLKRDWVGLKVKTKVELTTKGGAIFPAGTLMEVHRNFGGLELEAVEACPNCKLKFRHLIKRVSERDVVIVDQPPPVQP